MAQQSFQFRKLREQGLQPDLTDKVAVLLYFALHSKKRPITGYLLRIQEALRDLHNTYDLLYGIRREKQEFFEAARTSFCLLIKSDYFKWGRARYTDLHDVVSNSPTLEITAKGELAIPHTILPRFSKPKQRELGEQARELYHQLRVF